MLGLAISFLKPASPGITIAVAYGLYPRYYSKKPDLATTRVETEGDEF